MVYVNPHPGPSFPKANYNTAKHLYTEWPKKMYTLFTHQYLWNKFKLNFSFRARV